MVLSICQQLLNAAGSVICEVRDMYCNEEEAKCCIFTGLQEEFSEPYAINSNFIVIQSEARLHLQLCLCPKTCDRNDTPLMIWLLCRIIGSRGIATI